jgi:flagellar biosynthesis protein FlhG
MDQAEGLCRPIEKCSEESEPSSKCAEGEKDSIFLQWPRVISVSSGKGGVGKTNVVANLAFAFTRLGKKVLVLDGDLGLANIDVLLGLTPQYTIEHLLNREKSLSEILIKGPGGMSILAASSGILELLDLDESQKIFLLNELDLMDEAIDFLLIDTGAGISSNVLFFNKAAMQSIVIATPEPTSILDAYALIKVIWRKHRKKNFTILVNSAQEGQEAKEVFKRICMVADRFLGSLSIDYLGFIPFDEKLPSAVKQQRLVLEIYPQAPSSRSFMEMAKILAEKPLPSRCDGNIQFFWKQLFQYHQSVDKNRGVD